MVMQEEVTLQPMEKELVPRRAARRRRQGGFTLIEMLAVVVILAIVAGVGFVVVNNQIDKAKTNTDIANVRTIADATQRYILDKNTVPSVADLVNNGYLAKAPVDPWDATHNDPAQANYPYKITTSGNDVVISGVKSGSQTTLKNAAPANSSSTSTGSNSQ